MTYDEALKVINENLAVAIHDFDDPTDEYQREQAEALQKAKEALKKQVPLKLIYSEKINSEVCPVCLFIVGYYYHYCNNCGQRLDWRE